MAIAIGIFVFPGVEELDFVGPWEVLRSWERLEADGGVRVFTLAADPGVVECAKGMRVEPDETWATAPPIDVLVYPGGMGTRDQLGDERIRSWVRDVAQRGALMTSVCTGSLVYADAGLLDGRPATTWHGAIERLSELGARADAHSRFVDDGDVVTSAGVSAGIDMALHLVARLHSVERARQVRRYIQYDPEPPV
jgi:transcriptional regulator GlxA family with amidase domain